MKIYTRKGDDGTTGLLGGTRLPKHDLRIESYGTLDELNVEVGSLRDFPLPTPLADALIAIQNQLFVLGSHLAADPYHNQFDLPEIKTDQAELLESWIDAMDQELPPLKNFILPGGDPAVTQAHRCRVLCRKAERTCTALAERSFVPPFTGIFLNRLSDYFFTVARFIALKNNTIETPWQP